MIKLQINRKSLSMSIIENPAANAAPITLKYY